MTGLIVLAAIAALLALSAARFPVFDVLTHGAPVYAALGLAGVTWSVLAGRGPVVAASVLAVLAAGVVMTPELQRDMGPRAGPTAPGRLKVIHLNALRRNADIDRVADWLIAQQPDIVTITEARRDLRDLLVRRAGWRTAGARGAEMIFTARRYVRMDRPRLPGGARADYVNATYDFPGGPVEVVTTHLGWPVDPRVADQRRDLADVVSRLPRDRMILTGDFNAAPWSQAMRGLDASLGLIRRDRALPTWPARVLGLPWPAPFLPIDHVYAGPDWATVSVTRGPRLGSDHYPLVVILAPRAGTRSGPAQSPGR